MRAILISIRPQWVEKILNGEKTIEIRKTKPNIKLPCKVYIYCTKGKPYLYRVNDDNKFELTDKLRFQDSSCFVKDYNAQNGKVVAEFTLNKIDKFDSAYSEWAYSVAPEGSEMPISETQFIQMAEQKGKLDCNDLLKYFGDEDYIAYMWHIDNLKIYDKPKELSEFSHYIPNNKCPKKECGIDCEDCMSYDGEHETCLALYYSHWQIKRPPQSWCYVNDLEGDAV